MGGRWGGEGKGREGKGRGREGEGEGRGMREEGRGREGEGRGGNESRRTGGALQSRLFDLSRAWRPREFHLYAINSRDIFTNPQASKTTTQNNNNTKQQQHKTTTTQNNNNKTVGGESTRLLPSDFPPVQTYSYTRRRVVVSLQQ